MTIEYKITPGALEAMKAEVAADIKNIVRACTSSQGQRKGKLKTSKPKSNGLHQYVWRMVRFHTGADLTMPICCQFDLMNWIESHGEVWSYCGGELKALEDFIETEVVDVVAVAVGGNPYIAAQRWGNALGYGR